MQQAYRAKDGRLSALHRPFLGLKPLGWYRKLAQSGLNTVSARFERASPYQPRGLSPLAEAVAARK